MPQFNKGQNVRFNDQDDVITGLVFVNNKFAGYRMRHFEDLVPEMIAVVDMSPITAPAPLKKPEKKPVTSPSEEPDERPKKKSPKKPKKTQ